MDSENSTAVGWKPLTRNQRRVFGVLVEKAKTTPDAYPMSLNGIKVGANQKSNRSPQLDLTEHQVEDALYDLRQFGCVVEIHSGGRVPKFKHQGYEWLGVEKAELGVMAELLLRGEQTIGELRARAARMEKSVLGLEELRPILASLKKKKLIVELSPSGRGQVVTHNLYQSEELERLRSEFANHDGGDGDDEEVAEEETTERPVNRESAVSAGKSVAQEVRAVESERLDGLLQELEALKATVSELSEEVAALRRLIES